MITNIEDITKLEINDVFLCNGGYIKDKIYIITTDDESARVLLMCVDTKLTASKTLNELLNYLKEEEYARWTYLGNQTVDIEFKLKTKD